MNIKELIKGIIIGIAKIIPGLSGAVLMISFNLYDRAIEAITCFFKNPKKHFFFLLNLGIGIVVGIVLFSKVISFFLTHYYLYTMVLFIGLIFGGIPVIATNFSKNGKNYMIVFLSFFLMSALSLSNINTTYQLQNNYVDTIIFFLSGVLEALGTVLPGISSTALLMLIGVYSHYITTISNLFDIGLFQETLSFMIPFSGGMFLGVIGVSLLVNYLFKYYKEQTFSFILGVSLSSIFLLIIKIFPFIHSISSFGVSVFLLLIGYLITCKL